jgi:hypothetical protein
VTLWDFLGQYWWLVFPLLGASGAVAGGWEKATRRRHRRRLEILRAKSELKAAQAAGSPASPAVGSQTQSAQVERLFAAHDAVTARWLEYELDVAKIIAFPAMSDGRQPLTAAFLRAKRVADNLRPASPKARLTAQELAEYRDAVTDYEVAFDLAERDARRLKDSSFSPAERRRLEIAQQLLTVAVDQAATPAERQLAYRRVREELDGLLSLSDEAVDVLERKVALELPAARSAATPGATGGADTPDAAAGSGARDAAGPSAAPHAVGPSAAPHAAAPADPAVAEPVRPEGSAAAGAGRAAPPRPPRPGASPAPAGDTAPGRVIRPKRTA